MLKLNGNTNYLAPFKNYNYPNQWQDEVYEKINTRSVPKVNYFT